MRVERGWTSGAGGGGGGGGAESAVYMPVLFFLVRFYWGAPTTWLVCASGQAEVGVQVGLQLQCLYGLEAAGSAVLRQSVE